MLRLLSNKELFNINRKDNDRSDYDLKLLIFYGYNYIFN